MANTIPASLIMIILLTAQIIILFSHRLRRNRTATTPVATISSSQQVHALASDLTVKLERVQDDFIDLERRLCLHRVHEEETEIARAIDSMYVTFVSSRSRLAICEPSPFRNRRRRRRRLSSLCNGYRVDALDTTRMSGAFTSFCERLLAMNRVWKQEKQLKKLQLDVSSVEASRRGSAFSTFCDKLLLQNKVWQLEKQVGELELESATLKRRFEATVKRAAKKMMEELKHNRLTEGYIKEIIAELYSYKLALGAQSALREHELKEFTWEWYQDYSKLARETEKLNLARRTSSVQQELQNSFEDSLYESLMACRKKVEELEARLEGYQHGLVDVPEGDDITEVDQETVTTSSFTCVSSDDHEVSSPARKSFSHLSRMPETPRATRSARWIDNSKRETLPKPKKLILGGHTGFSFNPLFYGPSVPPLALMARHRPFDEGQEVESVETRVRRQAEDVRTKGDIVRWRI